MDSFWQLECTARAPLGPVCRALLFTIKLTHSNDDNDNDDDDEDAAAVDPAAFGFDSDASRGTRKVHAWPRSASCLAA